MSEQATHLPGEEYAGPATAAHDGTELGVTVRVRGHLQPIDGHFHWWTRLPASDVVDGWGNGATVRLRTPHGEAHGRLSDVDPWGRYRLSGTGRPPF